MAICMADGVGMGFVPMVTVDAGTVCSFRCPAVGTGYFSSPSPPLPVDVGYAVGFTMSMGRMLPALV